MDYVSTSLVPLFPTMLWNTKMLYDHHYLVDTTRNPKIDWPEHIDEDPFGLQWEIDLCFFILHFYVGNRRELTEVLSAQRISHPDVFGYHVYFNAKRVPGGVCKLQPASCSELMSQNIFAEIFISRKSISKFVPKVTYCAILKPKKEERVEKDLDYRSCYYCCPWVPHPDHLKSIKFQQFPKYDPICCPRNRPPGFQVCKEPWTSYLSPGVRQHVPKRFNREGLPTVRFRKLDENEKEMIRVLKAQLEEEEAQSLETTRQNLEDTHL